MAFKSYRQESKTDWGTEGGIVGIEQIQTGALLRIADATERMASNYARMENDLAMYKRWYEAGRVEEKRLSKSNAALRGHLKSLKKQK